MGMLTVIIPPQITHQLNSISIRPTSIPTIDFWTHRTTKVYLCK